MQIFVSDKTSGCQRQIIFSHETAGSSALETQLTKTTIFDQGHHQILDTVVIFVHPYLSKRTFRCVFNITSMIACGLF